MGDPRIDSLHDVYEDQLSAARFKAERDAARQRLQAMRERNIELWMESGMANELVTCAEQKAERLGKLVWRLQNRLARAHRREKALRKGMRMWREKAISGPVRTVSAYDLLPEDDLQTLRWVREQGGLDSVKKLLDWVIGHCSTKQQLDFDFWLSGRVMYELGFGEDMADRDEVERRLLARLMPDGCEWLRYEDGEPVPLGGEVTVTVHDEDGDFDRTFAIRSIKYKESGVLLEGTKNEMVILSYGERVKRPVPASDGEPLEVGQTVWDTNGDELVVVALEDGGNTVTCRYADVGDGIPVHGMWSPSDLTHTKPEPPDSWERIEEDLGDEIAKQQCGPISPELACKLAGEFVRRCQALAERGE